MLTALAAAYACIGYAQNTFLVENFDYPANTALQSNGWTAHSAGTTNPIQVVSPGLSWSTTPYLGSGIGNAAAVDNTGSDENRPLNPFNVDTGSIYVSFLTKVNAEVVGNAAGVFFHMGHYTNTTNPDFSNISTAFRARVHKRPGTTPDKFRFAVSFNAATPAANEISTAEYDTGTTYLLVVKYDFVPGPNNDSVSLFVFADGDNIDFEPATPTLGPFGGTQADMPAAQYVALRQYHATQDVTVDGIIVRDYWEMVPAPIAPEPISPANNANLFINGPASNLATVTWSAAENFAGPINYEWQFDVILPGTFSPPVLALASDNGGLDTTLTLPFGAVDSILNVLGVNIGDTVPGVWRVKASNGNDSLFSDTIFNINIIRGIITSPFTAFNLLSPADSTSITVSDTSSQIANISWESTTAGTGSITYTWHAILPGGSFNSPLVSLASNNQGTDTLLELTFPQIDSLLAVLGVQRGDTVELDWTVEAMADTVSSFAAQVWRLQIIRLAPPISVKEFEALSQIQLFPNPASQTLNITQLPKNDRNISVAVVDQSGRVVMHKELVDGLASYSLNIEHLASGTYFVKISNAHVQNTMKFIKL